MGRAGRQKVYVGRKDSGFRGLWLVRYSSSSGVCGEESSLLNHSVFCTGSFPCLFIHPASHCVICMSRPSTFLCREEDYGQGGREVGRACDHSFPVLHSCMHACMHVRRSDPSGHLILGLQAPLACMNANDNFEMSEVSSQLTPRGPRPLQSPLRPVEGPRPRRRCIRRCSRRRRPGRRPPCSTCRSPCCTRECPSAAR
jgi:hypothetical protein